MLALSVLMGISKPVIPEASPVITNIPTGIPATNIENDLAKNMVAETMNFEQVFKTGIKEALTKLDVIGQLPDKGQPIEYKRDEWTLKGKKIDEKYLKALNLPSKLNIFPKTIENKLPSMVFQLGERYFSIKPWLWKIEEVILTKESLIIETTFKNLTYDKQERVPRQMYDLRTLGEKVEFDWSYVNEFTQAEFDKWKQDNNIN